MLLSALIIGLLILFEVSFFFISCRHLFDWWVNLYHENVSLNLKNEVARWQFTILKADLFTFLLNKWKFWIEPVMSRTFLNAGNVNAFRNKIRNRSRIY